MLYFHRISDLTMDWMSMINFKMFRKLCGDSALRNAVIVTNMWGQVDLQVGEAREVELVREDIFFKPIFDKGAQIARNWNNSVSARNIIRLVLNNHPIPLRIQRELVDERKHISETSASEELTREIDAQIKERQEEMRVVKKMRVLKEEMHVFKEEIRALKEEVHVLKEVVHVLKEEVRVLKGEK